ncbi:General substrate transporter [Corchorus olitorius]|uniref:General substrate transporter n=1 Tax=Corchorus olitorius TaxID=93759 RepID=A0A1R3JVZ0_9ROSI|nr:General substrate transporter [Corchorus olitorius]
MGQQQQQRTELTESFLFVHGHDDNLVYSEENGGVGKSAADSHVTTSLILGTFVGACISWGFGCAVKCSILIECSNFICAVLKVFVNIPCWAELVFFFEFFDLQLGYSSPTQSSIMEDLGLSVAEFSLFGSILSIGSILGAAVSGKTADLLGRRLAMWILLIFYISGWLAIAFTKVPWLLVLGRLSLGFTNGMAGFLAPIYIAEISPNNLRGRLTAMVPLINGWGMSFMYVVGSFVNWRILALIATISGLLQLPLLFFIPESPRWLAKVGRDKELEVAQGGISDLFQKKYVRPLLIVFGLMTFLSLGGPCAFAFYSGSIFVSAGVSSVTGLVTLAATQTLLGILGAYLIDKSGRRPLLLVSSAGLCISTFLTGLSFFLKEHNWWSQGTPILALIGLLMYNGSFVVASGIPWLLLAELFPINVKGSVGSICNFITSLGGWAVAYYFNFLIEWSSPGVFFIFSGFCFANFILAATMVPETKGQTLEEIQASITHSSE